jgi:hypothetical protein
LRSLNINPAQAATATFAKGDGCAGSATPRAIAWADGHFRDLRVNEEIQKMIYEAPALARLRAQGPFGWHADHARRWHPQGHLPV